MHLDQKHAPAVLDQPGGSLPLRRFDPAFGVDVNADQAMAVENLLEDPHAEPEVTRIKRLADPGLLVPGQRLAQDLEGFDNPPDLRGKRLILDVGHDRQRFGP